MTKTQFLERVEADFLPSYLTKYPQFEKSVREWLDNVKNDRMGAHGWGNLACIIVNHAFTSGLSINAIIEYCKEQKQSCARAGNFN